MADVLIVCVREDEPQAKALAEMFEAAGFSIGGAPSSDSALRSSGAGLVVWSQASIRSRPFLDAAQRVINAEKAVVASLIEPPPPSSIGDSPVFDLSRWDGDPNDPALDPLFFAVDRMVNTARASVGASAPQAASPAAYEPPPRPAPPRPQRPPEPASYAPPPRQNETLGSEAEHWRAIRDSRNPADFMDYLARYGPEGAFAEVAELRLKQLTSRTDPPPPGARSAPRPAPTPRAPPPPRPAMRMDPPPTRRADPPAPTRRPEPLRRPPPERTYTDLRDPPKEGGALRAFILIALLGGAALAGGLYFGGGIPDFASLQQEQIVDTSAPSAPLGDVPADAPALDEPVGVPLQDAASERPTQTAARRETPRETAPRERTTPAPTTTFSQPTSTASNNVNGVGGPVILSPSSGNVSSGSTPNSTIPVPPPSTTSPETELASASPPQARPQRAPTVVWAQRPSARRIADLYPARALREGVGGRVALDCMVRAGDSPTCSIATESPAGLGFGRAALSAAHTYRASPSMSDGTASNGQRTRIVVQFQAPQQ